MSLETWPATRAALSQIIFVGTNPPPAPYDGQEWIYPVDPTNGVNWRFKYNVNAATYKWEFIGGPPLQVESAGDFTLGSPQTSYNASLSPLSLTVPRAGWYDIFMSGQSYLATSAATSYHSPGQGVPVNDADCVQIYMPAALQMFAYAQSIRRLLTAAALTMYHRVSVSQTTDVQRRVLSITPVRIT